MSKKISIEKINGGYILIEEDCSSVGSGKYYETNRRVYASADREKLLVRVARLFPAPKVAETPGAPK